MPKVEKVLVYWEGDDYPYEMSRQEFMDSEQGTFMAQNDPTLPMKGAFAEYFKRKWESE